MWWLMVAGLLCWQDVDDSLQVDYVVLDVIARDASGALVTDLEAKDFVIRDGRKKIKASHFQKLDFRTKAVPQSGPLKDIEESNLDPIQQTMILVFDLGGLGQEEMTHTLEDVEVFLEMNRKRDDLQMFAFSMDKGMVSSQFTTHYFEVIDDLVALEAKMSAALGEQPMDSSALSDFETELGKCTSTTDFRNPQYDKTSIACVENRYLSYIEKEALHARKRLAVLERFLLFLARVPGLKSVYVISPGWAFQPAEPAGELARTYLNLRRNRADGFGVGTRANSNFTAAESNTPFSAAHFQLQLTSESLDEEYQRLTHLATANRVVMHSFFLPRSQAARGRAGLSNGLADAADTERIYHRFNKDLERGVSELADITGGSHVHVSDISDGLAEVVDGHRFYYVLAYPRPKVRRDKFRKLKIECQREGVSLSYRKGYFPVVN